MWMHSRIMANSLASRYMDARTFALGLLGTPKLSSSLPQTSDEPTAYGGTRFTQSAAPQMALKPAAFYRPEHDALRFFTFFGV
jgi:hypothetical protein